MARTGVCVPLEQHTGFEPAQAAWKAAVLPLHKCCILPVCPGCHALLTSALPLFSPDRGAGLSRLSDKKKEGDSLPVVQDRVEGRIGFEPIASGCACRCTSACASRPCGATPRGGPLFSCKTVCHHFSGLSGMPRNMPHGSEAIDQAKFPSGPQYP